MILLFLLFALLALVVNRKAILLIALIPLIQAVNSLIRGGPSRSASSYDEYGSSYGSSANSYGGPGSEMFGGTVVTMVIISLIMLLLAIYWSPIRRSVLGILPAGLRHRLAPSETSPIDQARHFE
jgi:hypothetical protein